MTTISPDSRHVTAINTFAVDPANQQAVIRLLMSAVAVLAKSQPGFVSATIHKSIDGKRVLNYVQWRTEQDFKSVFSNAEFMRIYTDIKAIAQPEPLIYEVVCSVAGTVN